MNTGWFGTNICSLSEWRYFIAPFGLQAYSAFHLLNKFLLKTADGLSKRSRLIFVKIYVQNFTLYSPFLKVFILTYIYTLYITLVTSFVSLKQMFDRKIYLHNPHD